MDGPCQQPSPENSNPLVGITVLLELKDGKVTASLEKATMSVEGAPAEGMTMNVDGSVEMLQTTELN